MMRSLMYAFAAVCSSGATAQTAGTPIDVSELSLKLARALNDRPVTPAMLDEAARPYASNLLNTQAAWLGPSCDSAVPACRAAADRIARDMAPRIVAARREVNDRSLAVIIDATMSQADIARSLAFAATPAGKALAAAMDTRTSPEAIEALPIAARQKLGEAMMPSVVGFDEKAVLERFYAETRDLPRAKSRRIPPPPMPPAPPPSPISPNRP